MRQLLPWVLACVFMLILIRLGVLVQSNTMHAPEAIPVSDIAPVAPPIGAPSEVSTPTPTSTPPQSEFSEVLRVVDGDTVDIQHEGEKMRLRLIGINTPETVDPRRTVECFGKEASAKTTQLLSGQRVRIETDASQGMFDKYGRMLAYVFTEQGVFVNQTLIAEGFAYEYTYRTPYKYQVAFKESERIAREEGRGLWAPGVCSQL